VDFCTRIGVTKIIEQEFLSQTRPSAEEIVRIVHQPCIEGKWKPVSRNAIRARINQLDPRTRTQRTRLGAKAARLEHTPEAHAKHIALIRRGVDNAYSRSDKNNRRQG
jgi:hypothetical protein